MPRKNRHKEIIDPAIERLEAAGYTCQNYHSPRSMPKALLGHPDLVVMLGGITWYVEVKPWYRDKTQTRRPPLNDNQCEWFWKFYPQFCATIRYVIATDLHDLLARVDRIEHDISVPKRYYDQLRAWRRDAIT